MKYNDIENTFDEIYELLHQEKCSSKLESKVKQVHRSINKLIKGKRKKQNRENSGLLKKCSISTELASFLNIHSDKMYSRVDINRLLSPILKPMQNPENRRELFPTKELKKLLQYNSETHGPLFYPTIQKLIQIHFK